MAKPDDQKIAAFLKAGLAGDQQAYRQFFHEIVPILKATVRSIAYMQNAEELEDIVQEVLTTLHNKRQSWKTDKPVLPWIYAITRHKTIDACGVINARKARRRMLISKALPISCRTVNTTTISPSIWRPD